MDDTPPSMPPPPPPPPPPGGQPAPVPPGGPPRPGPPPVNFPPGWRPGAAGGQPPPSPFNFFPGPRPPHGGQGMPTPPLGPGNASFGRKSFPARPAAGPPPPPPPPPGMNTASSSASSSPPPRTNWPPFIPRPIPPSAWRPRARQGPGPPPPPPFIPGRNARGPFPSGPPPPPPPPGFDRQPPPWFGGVPVEVESESRSASAESLDWRYDVIRHLPTINLLRTGLFAVLIIIFSLLLAACTASSSMNDIYILSLSYTTGGLDNNPTAESNGTLYETFSSALDQPRSIQEVRVGYLGLCLRDSDDSWFCDSNPWNLVEILRDANASDPLNLIWVANRFRTEAVSNIFLFMSLGLSFFGFVFGILFPLANLSTDFRLSRLTKFLHIPETIADVFSVSFLSSASILGIMFSAFTFAIWQHLVSAASRSMISNLSFDAVVVSTGPEVLALGWLAFVLSMGAMVSLITENRKLSWSAWSAESEAGGSAEERESLNPGAEGEENIEMTENPGLSGWQEPPPTNLGAVLQTMFYLAGQRDPEFMTRQRDTAAWTRPANNRNQGYAETIVDEGSER